MDKLSPCQQAAHRRNLVVRALCIVLTAALLPVSIVLAISGKEDVPRIEPDLVRMVSIPHKSIPLSAITVAAPLPQPMPPAAATPSPAPAPWYTEDDVSLLAAIISAEARGESLEGQRAVGCVVLNRLEYGEWGDTLEDVVYAKGQFSKPLWNYGDAEYQAAVECLMGERILPENILFFQTKHRDRWLGATWYMQIGGHHFYQLEVDIND